MSALVLAAVAAACPKGSAREPAAVPTDVRIDWPDAAVLPGPADAGTSEGPAPDAGAP